MVDGGDGKATAVRVRTAQFVMVPMWLLEHPKVRGNATRIAVYAGLRAVAWEAPEQQWRSIREIARSVADVIGLGEEACRKHLAVLIEIGGVLRLDDELVCPHDPPGLGTELGTGVPTGGDEETQTGDSLLLPTREEEENTAVGTTEEISKADLNKEHPTFRTFWAMYPRRKDRPEAVRAYNRAVRYLNGRHDIILDGLRREIVGWKQAKRPTNMIPYPGSWLNARGWDNDPDATDHKAASETERRRNADERQQSAIVAKIDAGDHETAWRMLVEKAGASNERWWWPQADEYLERGRGTGAIAVAIGIPESRIVTFKNARSAALAGRWDALPKLSDAVRELTA